MTTESNPNLPAPSRSTMQTMSLTPRTAEELWTISNALAKSDLVPAAYRGKPSNILLVGMRANELGLGLMMGLAEMHVIEGKVGMSSDLLTAIVRRSGKCKSFRLLTSDDNEARYEGERSDTSEKFEIGYSFAEAQAANLTGKQVWKAHRRAMLRARASAALARELWPDVCMGLYVMDEFEEIKAQAQPEAPQSADARPRTVEALKGKLKSDLGAAAPKAPGKPQAAPSAPPAPEPREAEIVQAAPAQQAPYDQLPGHVKASPDAQWESTDGEQYFEEEPTPDAEPQAAPASAEPKPEPVHEHPLLNQLNWYAPDMGGVDANDASELKLEFGVTIGRFDEWCDQNVWTVGPLKSWTPRQAIMGGEGGGRHTLLQKAVRFAIGKKYTPQNLPRASAAADYCLALMERRFELMRQAGVPTAGQD